MKKLSLIVLIALTVIIATYIGVDFFFKWHDAELRSSRDLAKAECDQRVSVLEQKIQHLEEELIKEKGSYLSPEIINDAFGRDISELISPKDGLSPDECQSLKQAVESFFYYLDNNGYSDRYNLKDGAFSYYKNVLTLLDRNPPQFAGESAEMLSLFRSMSHFSRILGKNGALIIKDIIENETDMVEPALAVFFQLFKNEKNCPTQDMVPSLSTMYQYAHFFLNTLSGKSYQMRRNSKLRILAQYYSVMIVRMAEEKSMNIYGIDPRVQAETLLYDIVNHRGLLYKDMYIQQLEAITTQTPGTLINENATL